MKRTLRGQSLFPVKKGDRCEWVSLVPRGGKKVVLCVHQRRHGFVSWIYASNGDKLVPVSVPNAAKTPARAMAAAKKSVRETGKKAAKLVAGARRSGQLRR